MSKIRRWRAREAEAALLKEGFSILRTKGSHRIYAKGNMRVTLPFHSRATLHPKIVKQVMLAIEEASETPQ